MQIKLQLDESLNNDFYILSNNNENVLLIYVSIDFYSADKNIQEWLCYNIILGFYFQLQNKSTENVSYITIIDSIKSFVRFQPEILLSFGININFIDILKSIKSKDIFVYNMIMDIILDSSSDIIQSLNNIHNHTLLDISLKDLIIQLVINFQKNIISLSANSNSFIKLPDTRLLGERNECVGTIFEIICKNLIFTNSKKYVFDKSSITDRDSAELYPDFIYKDNNSYFILDCKCYKNDDSIKYKDQILYSIVLQHTLEEKYQSNFLLYNIILIYSKNHKKNLHIKKKYICSEHTLYFIEISIPKCIESFLENKDICFVKIIKDLIDNFSENKKNTKNIQLSKEFYNFI